MKEIIQLIERFACMYSKCMTLENDRKDLHNKSSKDSMDSMLQAANMIKFQIASTINDNMKELSLDDINALLEYIKDKISSSHMCPGREWMSIQDINTYYYKSFAYEEILDYIDEIKEERIKL